MRSCIIRGVPRTTHTINRVSHCTGLNFVIEPKEIISPRGSAPSSVTKKSLSVCKKPIFKDWNTTGNCSDIKVINLFLLYESVRETVCFGYGLYVRVIVYKESVELFSEL